MNRTGTLTVPTPVGVVAERGPRRVQPRVVGAGGVLLLGLFAWLAAQYGLRHGALFLVGGALGLVLYQSFFGFTTAFRLFVTVGDGRGIRAQMLMFALATALFAPMLASGQVLGSPVVGSLAPVSLSVLVGAFIFAIGMQLGGG